MKRNAPGPRERTNRGSHSLRLLISARETRVLAARRGPRSLPRFEGGAVSSPALGPPPRAGKAAIGTDGRARCRSRPFSLVSSRRRAAASGTTAPSSPSSRGPFRSSTRSCPSGCTTRAATTRRCVCVTGAPARRSERADRAVPVVSNARVPTVQHVHKDRRANPAQAIGSECARTLEYCWETAWCVERAR
jgi:hypothetical protein